VFLRLLFTVNLLDEQIEVTLSRTLPCHWVWGMCGWGLARHLRGWVLTNR
jgi:hypothetical protein